MRVVCCACLLVISFPTLLLREVDQPSANASTAFGPWGEIAGAVVGVRFESNLSISIADYSYFVHTTALLKIFKADPRLPSVGEKVTLFEQKCQLSTEDGENPPWDASGPIPAGQRIAFVVWDSDLRAFRIGTVWF